MARMMDYLVVDTAGFISGVPLHGLAENVVTVREVVSEIRDTATRRRLIANPADVTYDEPDSESIARVTEMARKTGDVGALSVTDVNVLALTYMLDVRQAGGSTDHLTLEPRVKTTTTFYDPKASRDTDDEEEASEDEEDEEEGWITPDNLEEKKRSLQEKEEPAGAKDEHVAVACLTSDFAMQNVLVQMGLNVASASGKIIREARVWIFRCTACFSTTPRMAKKFCPKCGNSGTLKRVSVTLRPDGSQEIHISSRHQLSARGTKFPLPAPKSGKRAVNPRLCEDQPGMGCQQQRRREKAPDPDGDYYFTKNDVTSRSAALGMGRGKAYWEYKNPNAVGGRNRTGNRKKKNRA